MRRPLHLLLFDEPLAENLINSRFDKRGTDRFALTVAFPEVRNEFDVVSNVGLELAGALAEFVAAGENARRRSSSIFRPPVRSSASSVLPCQSKCLTLSSCFDVSRPN